MAQSSTRGQAASKPGAVHYRAEHGLGGVSGYDVAETTDEDPDRVATIAQLTSAYLRSQLYPGDPAWQTARDALAADPNAPGRIDSK